MINISIFGKDKKKVSELKSKLKLYGLNYSKKADIMISLGGDGTYLLAERKFPNIPKLLVRDKSICHRCDRHNFNELYKLLKKLKENKFGIKGNIKLEVLANKKRLIGVNDIVIRNKHQNLALRFLLKINNKITYKELIGDGLVFATPFGSTGYFYAIARKSFSKGIGIAFNNITIKAKPIVMDENANFYVKILRGNALVSADNNENIIEAKEGQVIKIKRYKDKAKIVII